MLVLEAIKCGPAAQPFEPLLSTYEPLPVSRRSFQVLKSLVQPEE